MNNEKQKILDMLERAPSPRRMPPSCWSAWGEPAGGDRPGSPKRPADEGQKLRVQVEGSTEESEDLHVNVSVPLVLARYADNFLSTCLPASAAEGMKAQGIDLRQLNLGAIVDVFEELEEDIVNVRVKDAHNDLLVRVYVE